jgi:hypothetical protein
MKITAYALDRSGFPYKLEEKMLLKVLVGV